MKRSILTSKYFPRDLANYTKNFKAEYKVENDEVFKGDVISYITVGIINSKGLPDIDDIYTLLKLGNKGLEDSELDIKLSDALSNEEYKERGLLGIFCDLCKDLCIDIPVNKEFTDTVNRLEDIALSRAELQKQITSLSDKIGQLLGDIEGRVNEIEDSDSKEADSEIQE